MILAKVLDTRTALWAFLAMSCACLLALSGCNRVPSEYRAFLDLPASEQHKVMREFPINRRIDYYLAGMDYMAPPATGLADDIALDGKQALPVLMKRLGESKSESDQDHIIYIFRVMHARYYKLNAETEALQLLQQTVDNMKDSRNKENGETTLRFIKTNQLPDLEEMLDKSKPS
jgi:hypothetical protein